MTTNGQLWVGTRSGLSVLDGDLQGFTTYTHDSEHRSSLSDDEVLALYEDGGWNHLGWHRRWVKPV